MALRDWEYGCSIEVEPALAGAGWVALGSEGCDILASVQVGDREVFRAEKRFRTWEVDRNTELSAGPICLAMRFRASVLWVREQDTELGLPGRNLYHEDFAGKSYVWKMA